MKQPDFYLAGGLLSVMQKAHTILLQVPASQQSKENTQGADETDTPLVIMTPL